MEKNVQNSCTGNSLHINTRYFFVKDRVDKKEIVNIHCNTEVMLDDYFLTTLQGRPFCMFREVLMGWKRIITLYQISLPSKEHVGECIDGSKYPKKTYVEALTTEMA